MITLSYLVNLAVLLPLLLAFTVAAGRMDAVFGPATDARAILVCIYFAIAVVSAAGLGLIVTGRRDLAVQIAVSLFIVQIIYKLATVYAVGLASPVVVTNLVVVVIHTATLATLWRS